MRHSTLGSKLTGRRRIEQPELDTLLGLGPTLGMAQMFGGAGESGGSKEKQRSENTTFEDTESFGTQR